MKDIYDDFASDTKNLIAYAIMHGGVYTGKVVIKSTPSHKHTLYLHHFGFKMVSAKCEGLGYDVTGTLLNKAANSKESDANSHLYEILKSSSTIGDWDYYLRGNGYNMLRIM